jgi:hypothetical protein
VEGRGAPGGGPVEKKGSKKPPTPEEAWKQTKGPGIGIQECRSSEGPKLKERLDRSLDIDTASHNILIMGYFINYIVFNWINKINYSIQESINAWKRLSYPG